MFCISVFLILIKSVIGGEYRIADASKFKTFVDSVNSGKNYDGTTVYLDADLSLSGISSPINSFLSTFDGQGHIIRNLKLSSSGTITGFFGSTNGLTIKNVVLDSTCSITNTYSGSSSVYVGGILAWCYTANKKCNIENSVNMASVKFTGSTSNHLYIAGFMGQVYPCAEYDSSVINSANYGSITQPGSSWCSSIGGIYGESSGHTSQYKYAQNCINYGAITHSGSTSGTLRLGGISGYAYCSTIENCVSVGKISSGTAATKYVGSIIGLADSTANIKYSYCTSADGINSLCGSGSPSTTDSSSSTISSTLLGKLNGKVTSSNGWNKWILNTNKRTAKFIINENSGLSLTSQLIICPNPSLTGSYAFKGWYSDFYYQTSSSIPTTISGDIERYGLYGSIVTVTFNANEGKESVPASKMVVYRSKYGNLPTTTRTGYTFADWFTEASGGSIVTSSTTVASSSNHAIYAHWTVNKYTISFDSRGGSACENITQDYDTPLTLPKPEKTGYTFVGWFDVSLTTNYTVETVQAENLTLYAKWEANTYNVTFDANGGEESVPTSKLVVYGDTYGELPEPSRTGYTFADWFTEASGGSIVNSSTTVTSPRNHTIYAHWTVNKYTISFDSRGGSACENITQDYNTPLTLPKSEKTGYTFVGWFDVSLTTNYTVETVQAENITLYAKWEANIYTVEFDEDCGIYNDSVNATFGELYDLPEPTDVNSTILWWDVEETGGRVEDGDTVSIADDITLCAVWETNPVSLDANGGSVDPTTINATYSETYNVLPVPSMTGYTFIGWFNETGENVTNETTVTTPYPHVLHARWEANTYIVEFDEDCGIYNDSVNATFGELYDLPEPPDDDITILWWDVEGTDWKVGDGDTVSIADDITLCAVWETNPVSLDASGGSVDPTTINATYSETYGVLPRPEKIGYTFIGWFNETGENVTNKTTVTTPYPHILHARWEANTYIVEFDVDGGEPLPDDKSAKKVTFNKEYGELPEPEKAGYTFTGWFLGKDGIIKPENIVSIANHHTLYAHWAANDYVVTFDVNRGDALPDDKTTKTVTFDKEYDELPEPNRSGYTFSGWFNENNEFITNETVVETPKNHSLYAKWTPNDYVVAFDVNSGDALPNDKATKTVIFDEKYGELPEPNKIGFAFAGWFTKASEGSKITPSTIVSTASSHTLYAQWALNKYLLKFDYNNGMEPVESHINFSDLVIYPADPEKEGYSFAGWSNSSIGFMPAENITVTAQWEANTYTVAFDVNGGDESVGLIAVIFDKEYGELPTLIRTGYTFSGWADSPFNGDEVNSTTTVRIPSNHTLYAIWTANKYVIAFVFENEETMLTTQSYGDAIIYPNKVPSKSFHKFGKWCIKGIAANSEKCDVTHVPANDLTFTASFDADSRLVAGFSVTIVAAVLFLVILIVLIFVMIAKKELDYEAIGVELDEYKREEERIFQQVETMRVNNDFAKTLKKPLKKAEKDKGLEEILAELEVECEDGGNDDDVIGSFINTSASMTVASAVYNKENLISAAEYLSLLYTTVRAQEEYQEFDELYFGMKDINNFMDKMDEETVSFGGIVSGFTNKRRAIQSLITKEEEENNNGMPRGVLFRVKNAKGHKISKVDEETDEVLFEINSVFKVEAMKEVSKNKFIVVDLSFISPMTKDEMVKV